MTNTDLKSLLDDIYTNNAHLIHRMHFGMRKKSHLDAEWVTDTLEAAIRTLDSINGKLDRLPTNPHPCPLDEEFLLCALGVCKQMGTAYKAERHNSRDTSTEFSVTFHNADFYRLNSLLEKQVDLLRSSKTP